MTTLRVGGDGLTTSADLDHEPYLRKRIGFCSIPQHGYHSADTDCPKCVQAHRDERGREAAQRIRDSLRQTAAQREAQRDGGAASVAKRALVKAYGQRGRLLKARMALAKGLARGVAKPGWQARMLERRGVIEAELARVEAIIAGAP